MRRTGKAALWRAMSLALFAIVATACADRDGDGVYAADCNDEDKAIFPSASEICDGKDNDCDGEVDEDRTQWQPFFVDNDGDGVPGTEVYACTEPVNAAGDPLDCDDANIAIKPGAEEVCDDVDNNCDEVIDEGFNKTWYTDFDEDGYGSDDTQTSCTQPNGTASNSDDCVDTDPAIHPVAPELCNATDDDCDGTADDGIDVPAWYYDADGDGYAAPDAPGVYSCTELENYSQQTTDCNDDDRNTSPGTQELCDGVDNDCDVAIDEGAGTSWYPDGDGDGHAAVGATPTVACTQPTGTASVADDCDDTNPAVTTPTSWYPDGDGDGRGAVGSAPVSACTRPAGTAAAADDCDDTNPAITTGPTWYPDRDDDGVGASQGAVTACTQPAGYVAVGNDCDDADEILRAPSPYYADEDGDGRGAIGAPPVYSCYGEGLAYAADDCDDRNRNVRDATRWYRDNDNDGHGDPTAVQTACTQPAGFTASSDDCDDTNAAVTTGLTLYPDGDGDGHAEPGSVSVQVCSPLNGYVAAADDCDDRNPAVTTGSRWFADGDGDGHGAPGAQPVTACTQPAGTAATADDCDDTDPAAITERDWWPDSDRDGDGAIAMPPTTACHAPDGFVAQNRDCNDHDPSANTRATEICNGSDDDCDGFWDESGETWYRDQDGDGLGLTPVDSCGADGLVQVAGDCDDGDVLVGTATTWYADADGDAYGVAGPGDTTACTQPQGYAAQAGDCADDDPAFHPGAVEADCADPRDLNCDGTTLYTDADGDLAATCQDCDDQNPDVAPGAPERCNTVDDDCDGEIDDGVQLTFYADSDSDTFGDPNVTQAACAAPEGFVAVAGDCVDGDADVNPGVAEVPYDNADNDCAAATRDDDLDGDGYVLALDCDDADPWVSPAFIEIPYDGFDNDCDPLSPDDDLDSDGVALASDCDDNDPTTSPLATEVCDGRDNDCDRTVDGDDTDLIPTPVVAPSSPNTPIPDNGTIVVNSLVSGTGTVGSVTLDVVIDHTWLSDLRLTLVSPTGWQVAVMRSNGGNTDNMSVTFDDAAATSITSVGDSPTPITGTFRPVEPLSGMTGQPIAGEWRLFVSDTAAQDIGILRSWTLHLNPPDTDVDNDGATSVCAEDCDDNDASTYPGAPEVCDDADNDCDLVVDEDVASPPAWYADLDGDRYGAGAPVRACDAPPQHVAASGDCNDSAPGTSPGATDTCGDGIDQDCSGADCVGAADFVGNVTLANVAQVCSGNPTGIVVGNVELVGNDGSTGPRYSGGATPAQLLQLACVTEIQGNLRISFSDTLTSLSGLENLVQISGSVTLVDLPQVTTIDALSGVVEAPAGYSVSNLVRLTDASALGGLVSVGGFDGLLLSSLNALTTVDLSSLQTVSNVTIFRNNGLRTVITRPGGTATTGSYVDIVENGMCQATADALAGVFVGSAVFSAYDNFGGCP